MFDCKWELDSLASFLQISVAYYQRTNDVKFFEKYHWIDAVKAAVDAAGAMRLVCISLASLSAQFDVGRAFLATIANSTTSIRVPMHQMVMLKHLPGHSPATPIVGLKH